MSTKTMNETIDYTTSQSKTNEQNMLIIQIYNILLGKYPSQIGEKAATYMERLLSVRQGSAPESRLFVETELIMLFHLVKTLRNELKKAKENKKDTTDIQTGYNKTTQRLEEYIDKWIELNIE